jgi:anti-sigma factor RsiW
MDKVKWRARRSQSFSVALPEAVIEQLCRLAERRETTAEALARLYIGQGIREDMRRVFDEEVLSTTETILAERLGSAEEAQAIVDEVRGRFGS